jgi:hypothetical protein
MHRLLSNVFRSSRQTQSALSIPKSTTPSIPKCMCSNNAPKSTTGSVKLPILVAFLSGTAIGCCISKSHISLLLSKLGLHHDTVDSHIANPEVARSDDPDVNKYLKLCEAVMNIAGKAVLSTVVNEQDHDRGVHSSPLKSRPVAPFPVAQGIPHIHIMTNKLSRKVQHMVKNPHVTLT